MASVQPVILAAGFSRRMGRPKPFLPLPDGRPAISGLLAALRHAGLLNPLVVINPAHRSLYEATRIGQPEVLLLENPQPDHGQLSSLRLALRALPTEASHALVALADMPFITSETFRAVAKAAADAPEALLVASCQRQPGHPLLIPRAFFNDLQSWEGPDGAKGWLRSHSARVREVNVADPWILEDADTPEDWAVLNKKLSKS